jgi:hypothetical protein
MDEKLLFHLLALTILHSYILYKPDGGKYYPSEIWKAVGY